MRFDAATKQDKREQGDLYAIASHFLPSGVPVLVWLFLLCSAVLLLCSVALL